MTKNTETMLWPEMRSAYLARRMAELISQPEICFTFVPAHSASKFDYFSEGMDAELAAFAPDPFVYCPPDESVAKADIVIHMVTGMEEQATLLWDDRRARQRDALFAVWLWDNHVSGVGNLQACLAADVVFPSHWYVSNYLLGPAAVVASHLPACCAQWTRGEAESYFARHATASREDKLLFNYVNYGPEYPERFRILNELGEKLQPIERLEMTKTDRRRYFEMSREERFSEWARFKATVIVPVDRDLSTRVFDALATGLIPIIPESITDLDLVVSRGIQDEIGIVRVPDLEVDAVQPAAVEALRLFDEMGPDGVVARHRFAVEHHMLVNRMTSLLEMIWRIGTGEFATQFDKRKERYGLALARNHSTE